MDKRDVYSLNFNQLHIINGGFVFHSVQNKMLLVRVIVYPAYLVYQLPCCGAQKQIL